VSLTLRRPVVAFVSEVSTRRMADWPGERALDEEFEMRVRFCCVEPKAST
jgi:hypothetical protein